MRLDNQTYIKWPAPFRNNREHMTINKHLNNKQNKSKQRHKLLHMEINRSSK